MNHVAIFNNRLRGLSEGFVKLMIERVDLVTGGFKIKWHSLGWKELIKEFAAQSIGAELVEVETMQ